MEFKQALKLLKQAEKKARKLNQQIDSCHIQFDNMQEIINNKYKAEWRNYCDDNGLAYDYTWGDTLV